MTNFFLLYYLTGAIYTVILIITVLFCIGLAGFIIAYFHNKFSYERNEDLVPSVVKYLKKLIVISSIMLIIAIFFPSKKTILAYYAFSQVDNYNIKVGDSHLNPEKMLEIVDKVFMKIDNLLGDKGKIEEKLIEEK